MSPGRTNPARDRHLQWGAQALWSQLEPLLPGLSIEVLARSASTNSELLERARIITGALSRRAGDAPDASARIGRRQADTQPCLLVAEHQMAGRGRLGRGWRSTRGASLTFSLAVALAPRDWSGLSLAVGIALAESLQGDATGGPLRLGLKWPNDLWLVDAAPLQAGTGLQAWRKLGGVLIETLAAGSQRLAVVGVGINIAPMHDALPTELQERLGCLRELNAQATAPAALALVALPLVTALRTFEREGFSAFTERFAALDLLRNQEIVTTDPQVPQGVALGVNAQGGLRVQAGESMHVISSGDVSVRPSTAGLALPAR